MAKINNPDADDGMRGTHSARATCGADLRRLLPMRRRRDELAALVDGWPATERSMRADLARVVGDLYALERLLVVVVDLYASDLGLAVVGDSALARLLIRAGVVNG
jgi:hypothetical protein